MSADPEAVTFPTSIFGTRSDTGCWSIANCAFCLTLAEAWAWRCADTMPDTAQGRRDSEADAKSLGDAMPELRSEPAFGAHPGAGCMLSAGTRGALKRGNSHYATHQTIRSARAAFRAVTGLRP